MRLLMFKCGTPPSMLVSAASSASHGKLGPAADTTTRRNGCYEESTWAVQWVMTE